MENRKYEERNDESALKSVESDDHIKYDPGLFKPKKQFKLKYSSFYGEGGSIVDWYKTHSSIYEARASGQQLTKVAQAMVHKKRQEGSLDLQSQSSMLLKK